MLQRHMIAVGFAVAAIQHRSGSDGQHILACLGFEINAAVKRFLLCQRMDCPAIRIRHRRVRILQRPDVSRCRSLFCLRFLYSGIRIYDRINMNDRLRGRSGRLNRVPFLHGHRRFRDTDSGLRLRCKLQQAGTALP